MIGDKIDRMTGAAVHISSRHSCLHDGHHFVMARSRALPVGNDDEILIVTPNTDVWAHMSFSVVSDAAVTLSIYETTTLTAGTALTAYNRNRNSNLETALVLTHTPTGSGDGTLIFTWSAGANIPVGAGAQGDDINVLILKQNTSYLVRVAGASGDVITLVLDWYEHASVT